MVDILDIELSIRAGPGGSYQAGLSAWGDGDAEQSFPWVNVSIDPQQFRPLIGQPAQYEQALSDCLFAADPLRENFAELRGVGRGRATRLRLKIDPSAAELHGLCWELLRLPGHDLPVCTREDILFSRYLPLTEHVPLPEAREKLSALVAIAAPGNLAERGYSPIEPRVQIDQAKKGLGGLEISWLGADPSERCTLVDLAERLADQEVLYLVCHGRAAPDGSFRLILEDERGEAQGVRADKLTARLEGMLNKPRLAVLSVCASGEPGSIGPLLLAAGIPAVIAMQGDLSFETAARFFPVLFRELREHGTIDRAAAAARRAILDRPDAWAPMLFMGLKSGQLWKTSLPQAKEEPPSPRPVRVGQHVPNVPRFIGREKELAAYREQLRGNRLAIITGMAGVGKTWLGARLAREFITTDQDIFWFTFDVRNNTTGESLIKALAEFLEGRGYPDPLLYLNGQNETSGKRDTSILLGALASGLQAGRYVICLDDFEVVQEDPDILIFFNFLRQHGQEAGELPALFILMGRELPPEMEYLVSRPLRGFSEGDSRVYLTQAGLQLAEPLFRRLWELTEGNPMLLHLSLLGLKNLAAEDERPEQFLERMAEQGDVRDFLFHNILERLPAREQETIQALSIFPGVVERKDAIAVLSLAGLQSANERIDVLVGNDVLSEIAGRSLRLHALLREYCIRVMDPALRDRFHGAAAEYFAKNKDFLLAGYHYFERGEYGTALTLLKANVRAIVRAGSAKTLLDLLERCRRPDLTQDEKAMLSWVMGDAYHMLGKYEDALGEYADAKIIINHTQDDKTQANLLYSIGLAHSLSGSYTEAIKVLRKSERLSRSAADLYGSAQAGCAIAWALYRQGRSKAAGSQFTACYEMGLRLGGDILVARAGLGLGLLARARPDPRGARRHFERSLEIFKQYGDRVGEVEALNNLGLIFHDLNEPDLEIQQYQQALEIAEQMGDVHTQRVIYNNLGYFNHLQKNYPQAAYYFQQLADLSQQTGHTPMLSTAYTGLADACLALGDLPQAQAHAQNALTTAQKVGPSIELAASYRVLGEVYLAQDDAAGAKGWFEKSIVLLHELDEGEELAQSLQGLERANTRLQSNQE